MIVWVLVTTDGGYNESKGKAYLRPSEARSALRDAVGRMPEQFFPLDVVVQDHPGEGGWHRFDIVNQAGDTVGLHATALQGEPNPGWPMQSGQVLFAWRMLNEIVREVENNG